MAPWLERRLKSYLVAAGAAGVGMLATAPPAEADIVFTPLNVFIGLNSTVDLTVNGNAEFAFHNFYTGTFYGGGFLLFGYLKVYGMQPGASVVGGRLPGGAIIGPANVFRHSSQMVQAFHHCSHFGCSNQTFGVWPGASHGFLGLKFAINGQAHFGWAELSDVQVKQGQVTATLDSFAYNTVAGQPIQILPEPATLGLLAIGAAGIGLWRKRARSAGRSALGDS